MERTTRAPGRQCARQHLNISVDEHFPAGAENPWTTWKALTSVFNAYGVGTSHRPINTIRSILVHPKDRIPDAQKCGLVYQVECPECPLTYIGETGRTLAMRIKDHLNLRNPLTDVGEHCAHDHHKITKDSVRVLAREDSWLKRKVRKALKIKIGQPAMNRH